MNETARHLVERVVPEVRTRQRVLSFQAHGEATSSRGTTKLGPGDELDGQVILPTRRKARIDDFDLDAEVAVAAHDRERREARLRYFLRPRSRTTACATCSNKRRSRCWSNGWRRIFTASPRGSTTCCTSHQRTPDESVQGGLLGAD